MTIMGRTTRLILLALVAAMALGAGVAVNASAGVPELQNQNNTAGEVAFDAHSGLTTIRGERLGVVGRVSCERDLVLGGAFLVPGMLVDKFVIHLSGKCELNIGTTKIACTEPILTHPLHGELGFIKGTSGTVGLLVKPETGEEFTTVTCGAEKVTIDGEVVGEIPEVNKSGANQYNKLVSSLELRFARVVGKETEQVVTTFELLAGFPPPLSMTGVTLTTSGAFGGKASIESTETVLPAALVRLLTV
jgi:hypothetical protein